MASLKDLKLRINSVKSTQKITKAMKMVAASKLRRAQEAAEAARPYAARMEQVLASLAAGVVMTEDMPKLLTGTGKDDVHLLVVATAERGLCGGFNSSIVRLARQRIQSLIAQGKTVKVLCVGRKGRDALRRDYGKLIIETIEVAGGVRKQGFPIAARISEKLFSLYEAGEFDVATVFYAEFKSAIAQIPTAQQIIPAALPEGDVEGPDLKGAIFTFEPDEEEILEALLPRNVAVQIYRALLENAASEEGARMSAMDNATRNAGDMINRLTLTYNRTRQAAITKELIEIISGAEAL
ncbi:F0F1 ATP synthase subunit gamma [Zavarzinia compransoris]|uniref:F0F1 ATP synthase subunit gamma n=1 Tax=Zavarzinia marina TaxID=2911065 RepID=UPI001F26F420|nr:F0F1 ATP synthase subunit gamma [Zavarzinia marina]MCF4165665.1 F0F1 ATP synthase subunit gamma [Zavarzinia marina]